VVRQALALCWKPFVVNTESLPFKIDSPDGAQFVPEVQVIDTTGNTINLKLNMAAGTHMALYTLPMEVQNREFSSVRIRSDKSVKCKKIIWLTSHMQ
jgi:hypothetical protein